MSFTISDAISDLQQESNTIGQRVSESDWLLFFHRANEYFNTNYKMPTSQRAADLLLFKGVYEYAVPSDFLGMFMPERPYDLLSPTFQHTSEKEFTHYIHGNLTGFKFNRETQYLLANYDAGDRVQLHTCNTYNEEGTWAVSGDGASIATDEQIYTQGEGSVRATVTGATGSTVFTISDAPQTDIGDYLLNAWAFVDIYNPNDLQITSVELRIGSDASNYYSMTATTRKRGDNIMQGWGLVGFDMSTKTTTGTPTTSAIDYIRIAITHSVSASGTMRIDNVFISEAVYFQLPYYSKFNVKSAAGSYIQRPTATDDTMLCPTEANSAYAYKALEYAAMLKLEDPGLASYARGELLQKEMDLKAKYPKGEARSQTNWYKRSPKF